MPTVAAMSTLLSNNTIVALFINVVKVWAKNINLPPSKLLIPLSYAATLGGLCTIIGTPANLLVAEFYSDSTGRALRFFAPLIPGIACTIAGILTTILLQHLLPVRKSPEESFESSKNYTVELLVPTECSSVGMTVEEAKLLNVVGGHLVEIVRFDREIISPVPPDEFILGGDHLVYSGKIEDILQLRVSHGLVNATHHVFSVAELGKNRKLQMANVGMDSSLVGHRMADTKFEERNGVVLVAVAREGERINAIPRETVIRAGDTLLFEGNKMKPGNFADDLHFFDKVALPQEGPKTYLSMLILLLMVMLSAFNIMPLLYSTLLAAVAMVVTQCCSIEQVQRSINWKLIMVFAGSVCLGKAIEVTGLSEMLGAAVTYVAGTNALIALLIICTFGSLVTEFISNTTAAAVLIPIALQTASSMGANPMTFAVALMISVSSSFATPIGCETNVMIYGLGGYKFADFVKIGLPMNVVILLVNLLVTCIVFPL
jgi:di/tricarboxylate transporter